MKSRNREVLIEKIKKRWEKLKLGVINMIENKGILIRKRE